MRKLMARLTIAVGLGAAAFIPALVPQSLHAESPRQERTPAPIVAVANDAPIASSSFHFPQIGEVTAYRPAGSIKGVALFLSGDGAWNQGVINMAKILVDQGMAVAGISMPAFQKSLEANSEACFNPNFALTALAQDFEHRIGVTTYIKPILFGYSSGATIAYAAVAQAPAGTYRGVISLGFGPDIGGVKPWCKIPNVTVKHIEKPEAGWLFSTAPHLPAPWLVLQGLTDPVVSPAVTRAFTAKIPEAQLIELPKVGHGFEQVSAWVPQFAEAVAPMLEQPAAVRVAALPPELSDLPLTVVVDPAAPRRDVMAVMYSGDGGWAGIDRDIAGKLAASGVPVVGVDSLSYFWNAKSPGQAGEDAGQIVAHYAREWHCSKVIFVGYSFGADNLAYIVGNLPAAIRPMVERMSLLGLGATADFQFHLMSWLDISGDNGLPTLPAIERLRGLQIQCVRGQDEADSACPTLPDGLADKIVLPGGHHFGGNVDAVASTILKGVTG